MKSYSGKFVLRVDPSLHRQLKREAEARDLSLNEWIVKNLSGTRTVSPSPVIHTLKKNFESDLIGVIQFGSSVRGEMREGSDVDLLIVLDGRRPVDRSLYSQWDRFITDPVLSPQFSHLPTGPDFTSLWLEVAIEGVILFDPTKQLDTILRQIRSAIAEGKFSRKMSHGHPYWVRKEASAE